LISRTALAESELEYVGHHESPSVYLGLDLSLDLPSFLSHISETRNSHLSDGDVKLVIWTTTPWTIPGNKAVAFKESETYSLLLHDSYHSTYYVVASALEESFAAVFGKKLHSVLQFRGLRSHTIIIPLMRLVKILVH